MKNFSLISVHTELFDFGQMAIFTVKFGTEEVELAEHINENAEGLLNLERIDSNIIINLQKEAELIDAAGIDLNAVLADVELLINKMQKGF